MEPYIYDHTNGLWYELKGDYYFPCFFLPEDDPHDLGLWGRRYYRHIKAHRPVLYASLLLSGKLNRHLHEIDEQAQARLDLLIRQIAARQGITEQLKAHDPMEWAGAMNNIRSCAEEIVLKELICEEEAV